MDLETAINLKLGEWLEVEPFDIVEETVNGLELFSNGLHRPPQKFYVRIFR